MHPWYTSAANQGLMIKHSEPLWLTHLITEILEYYRCIRIKHGGLRYGSMWNHSDFISSSFALFWFSCWFSAITWMFHSCSVRCVSSLCLCECRLGKPASGKRFLGDLSVSAVESVPAAAPLPAVARLHLDLPLAHSSDHAWCGQYTYMHIHAFPCSRICHGTKKSTHWTPSDDFCLVFYGLCDWPITIVCQSMEVAM